MPATDPNPGLRVVDAWRSPLHDLYHGYLRLPLGWAVAVIVGVVLAINAVFTVIYLISGGIENAAPGSVLDAFSFSVQTLVTIGYGAMYPASPAAKLISDVEAITGLLVTAVATGLVFTRFARPRGTIRFTSRAVITPMNGVPTLVFRVGNDRGNLIFEAQARVVLTRTEQTLEGRVFYRMLDLQLSRDRSLHFARSWTLLHPITEASPLFGMDAARLKAEEIELTCAIVGIDDTSLQPIHARKTWYDHEILFGHRLVDLLRELPDGSLEADGRRFDEVEPDGSGLTRAG